MKYCLTCSSKRHRIFHELIERGNEQLNYDFNLRNIIFACNGKTSADKVIAVIELDEQITHKGVELEELQGSDKEN
jgi:uncharacterized protein YceH (UPF0502 family)